MSWTLKLVLASITSQRPEVTLYVYSSDGGGRLVSAVFRVGEEISFGFRNNTVPPDTGPLRVSACGLCNAIVAAHLLRFVIRLTPFVCHFPTGGASARKIARDLLQEMLRAKLLMYSNLVSSWRLSNSTPGSFEEFRVNFPPTKS